MKGCQTKSPPPLDGVAAKRSKRFAASGSRYTSNPTARISASADVYYDQKEYDEAIADYTRAINLGAKNAEAFNSRGAAYSNHKEYGKALADYAEAIRIDPDSARPYNNTAWILATCPNDAVRDGGKALELATKACELSRWKVAHTLDTLAAAHAESGNPEEAVEWQKKAMELTYDNKEEAENAKRRLKLYEEGKPYREE